MAFLLNKTSLSKLRLNPPQVNEASMLTKRAIHIEPGAREKALLAADPSLKRFKSHKQSVRTLKRVGDVLTIVVVAGCCYEIYVRAVMRQEERKKAEGSA